jgi:hypothetical protein
MHTHIHIYTYRAGTTGVVHIAAAMSDFLKDTGVVLKGNTIAVVANGQATFTDLQIDRTPDGTFAESTGWVLSFSSAATSVLRLNPSSSPSFTLTPGAVTALSFRTQVCVYVFVCVCICTGMCYAWLFGAILSFATEVFVYVCFIFVPVCIYVGIFISSTSMNPGTDTYEYTHTDTRITNMCVCVGIYIYINMYVCINTSCSAV